MPVNKMEDIKKNKDGLDVIHDMLRYANEGFDAIDPNDMDLFKWYGVYQQKPKDGHFMMRIKVPGGHYTSAQLRQLAKIGHDFARGFGDITTRQAFQFHWLTIQDIPEIFRRLKEVGMSTAGACGDIMRNITGCPLAGIDREEVFNAQPEVLQIEKHFLENREYSNLPRKYKPSIGACAINCYFPQINCFSLVGVPHGPAGWEEEGYNVYVGGGLSTSPHFAKGVDIFIPRDKALQMAIAVTEIFRDNGGRERRTRARLKFLMDDWGPEKFREEIQKHFPDFELPRASGHTLRDAHHDHLGIHPQKQEGLNYIGVTVTTGRITASQMAAVADIADNYGSGRLANTISQNFVVLDIPDAKVEQAAAELRALGFTIDPVSVRSDCVVCTGKEFCNLAVTETKGLMMETIQFLEREVNWDRRIRVHMTGCPNNCGQAVIADIGMQGAAAKVNGETVDAYDFYVGGGLGEDPSFVRKIARRISTDEVKVGIANLVRAYQAERSNGQTFRQWSEQFSDEELAGKLGVYDIKLKEEAQAG